jgi:hypothetical protein
MFSLTSTRQSSVVVLDQQDSDIPHTMVEFRVIADNYSEPTHASMQGQSSSHSDLSGLDVATRILDIIFEYALNKFDDSKDRLATGKPYFLSVIQQYVMAEQRVETCLPAFPFKSANKVYKVLGSLPDKAEELALQRLNSMCARIKEVYRPGARVTIISDGITYNGTLAIPSPVCNHVLTKPCRSTIDIRP